MFVPVACSQCGKPFQVPEEQIGSTIGCPWCKAAVLALPVGLPNPVQSPPPAVSPPAPPPPQPAPEPHSSVAPVVATAKEPRRPSPWSIVLMGVSVLIVTAGVTIAVQQLMQPDELPTAPEPEPEPPQPEWHTFTAPDGSFTIELPGEISEVREATNTDVTRFIGTDNVAKLTAWVAWRDLTPAQIQTAGTKDAWQHFLKPFDAERDWMKKRFDGEVVREATVKFEDPLTREVELTYPNGRVFGRFLVLPKGTRPRIYFLGIAGNNPDVDRFLNSFQVNE